MDEPAPARPPAGSTNVLIKNPSNDPGTAPFALTVPTSETIGDVKARLCATYPGGPPVARQRLIFSGKLLSDDAPLSAVLAGYDLAEPQTFHMVVSGAAAPPRAAAAASPPRAASRDATPPSASAPAPPPAPGPAHHGPPRVMMYGHPMFGYPPPGQPYYYPGMPMPPPPEDGAAAAPPPYDPAAEDPRVLAEMAADHSSFAAAMQFQREAAAAHGYPPVGYGYPYGYPPPPHELDAHQPHFHEHAPPPHLHPHHPHAHDQLHAQAHAAALELHHQHLREMAGEGALPPAGEAPAPGRGPRRRTLGFAFDFGNARAGANPPPPADGAAPLPQRGGPPAAFNIAGHVGYFHHNQGVMNANPNGPRVRRYMFQIDLNAINWSLIFKLIVAVLLLKQEGSAQRLYGLVFAAVFIYLWQTDRLGALRRIIEMLLPSPPQLFQALASSAATVDGERRVNRALLALSYMYSFVYGFVCSLVPSWDPVILPDIAELLQQNAEPAADADAPAAPADAPQDNAQAAAAAGNHEHAD